MDVSEELYLLDNNPFIKYLLLTKKKEKQFWVNDIFEDGKIWRISHTFSNQLNFYYILEKIQTFLEKTI